MYLGLADSLVFIGALHSEQGTRSPFVSMPFKIDNDLHKYLHRRSL